MEYLHVPTNKVYKSNGAGRLIRTDNSTNQSLPLWIKDNSLDWKPLSEVNRIQELANYLWDKWALRYDDKVIMTKDLFLLALQDDRLKTTNQ